MRHVVMHADREMVLGFRLVEFVEHPFTIAGVNSFDDRP
jgi:hypothetical protein